jgi:hypothetical protein
MHYFKVYWTRSCHSFLTNEHRRVVHCPYLRVPARVIQLARPWLISERLAVMLPKPIFFYRFDCISTALYCT